MYVCSMYRHVYYQLPVTSTLKHHVNTSATHVYFYFLPGEVKYVVTIFNSRNSSCIHVILVLPIVFDFGRVCFSISSSCPLHSSQPILSFDSLFPEKDNNNNTCQHTPTHTTTTTILLRTFLPPSLFLCHRPRRSRFVPCFD
jgi:hypothetical protein